MSNKSDKKGEEKAGSGFRLKSWWWKYALLPAVIAIGVLISMRVPVSAPVEIKAEVNRVSITPIAGGSTYLLPHTAVCSLDLGGFKEARVPIASIWIADLAREDRRTGSIAENGWKQWPMSKSLTLRPSEPRFPAKITLKTVTKCGPGLSVDGFHTGMGDILLASPAKDYLSLDLHGKQTGSVELPKEFEMDAEYCKDSKTPFPLSSPEVRLRVRLAEGASSFLTFDSLPSGMFAQLEFAPGHMQKAVLLDFPIQHVGFTNQGPLEETESTLSGSGTISYYRKIIHLAAGDVLTVEQLNAFSVLNLGAGRGEKSLTIDLKGRAGVLRSGRISEVTDRRPTWFDALSGDPRAEAIRKAIKAVRDIFK